MLAPTDLGLGLGRGDRIALPSRAAKHEHALLQIRRSTQARPVWLVPSSAPAADLPSR